MRLDRTGIYINHKEEMNAKDVGSTLVRQCCHYMAQALHIWRCHGAALGIFTCTCTLNSLCVIHARFHHWLSATPNKNMLPPTVGLPPRQKSHCSCDRLGQADSPVFLLSFFFFEKFERKFLPCCRLCATTHICMEPSKAAQRPSLVSRSTAQQVYLGRY